MGELRFIKPRLFMSHSSKDRDHVEAGLTPQFWRISA